VLAKGWLLVVSFERRKCWLITFFVRGMVTVSDPFTTKSRSDPALFLHAKSVQIQFLLDLFSRDERLVAVFGNGSLEVAQVLQVFDAF
jgi:hypothetical protein